ncbi:MAG: hypothetical protein P4L99_26725 [Chthoniobacter sp.]|nr:hypothetical protein [Chthoniobacter sp.]
MNRFRSTASLVAALVIASISCGGAQDFTTTIRRMPDADAAKRADILRKGTPPPIEYSAKAIPLTPSPRVPLSRQSLFGRVALRPDFCGVAHSVVQVGVRLSVTPFHV